MAVMPAMPCGATSARGARGGRSSGIAGATTRSSRRLISEARNDPAFDERNDVLALMLQARYEDGSPISDDHIADELLTLLAAGHETTATTLAWAVERLRRHPRLLSRLTAEVDAGGSELLQATIWEVQRTRPVVEATARVREDSNPVGRVGHSRASRRHREHHDVARIRARLRGRRSRSIPDRFLGGNPDTHTWIPVRGRHPPMHRCRVRQHGDERHAAHIAARIRVRHNVCRWRASSLARRGHRTGARRSRRCATDERWDRHRTPARQSEPRHDPA